MARCRLVLLSLLLLLGVALAAPGDLFDQARTRARRHEAEVAHARLLFGLAPANTSTADTPLRLWLHYQYMYYSSCAWRGGAARWWSAHIATLKAVSSA